MEWKEKDLREIEFEMAMQQAMMNRLGEKFDLARNLVDKTGGSFGKSDLGNEMAAKIAVSIMAEHLERYNLMLTLKVFEPECRQDILRKHELEHLLRGKGFNTQGKGSFLEQIILQNLHSVRTKRDIGFQTGGFEDNYNSVEAKLNAVEREYMERERLANYEDSERMKDKLPKMRRVLEEELQRQLLQQMQIFKDNELRKMRAEERASYQKKLQELQLLAERTVSDKLRVLREREAEVHEDERIHRQHIEALRTEVQRKLLNDMHSLDRDKAEFKDMKLHELEKIKTLDFKLDKREAEIGTKEAWLDAHRRTVDDGLEQRREGLKNQQLARANVQNRQQAIYDGMVLKAEMLEQKLSKKESELEEKTREMRKREIELEDRHKQGQKLNEENSYLRDALNSQLQVSQRKETTLRMYEHKVESLSEENGKLKDLLNELKRNWILSQGKGQMPDVDKAFKPII